MSCSRTQLLTGLALKSVPLTPKSNVLATRPRIGKRGLSDGTFTEMLLLCHNVMRPERYQIRIYNFDMRKN